PDFLPHRSDSRFGAREFPKCIRISEPGGCALVSGRGNAYLPPMNDPTLGFTKEDPWRIFRMMAEFADSIERLTSVAFDRGNRLLDRSPDRPRSRQVST